MAMEQEQQPRQANVYDVRKTGFDGRAIHEFAHPESGMFVLEETLTGIKKVSFGIAEGAGRAIHHREIRFGSQALGEEIFAFKDDGLLHVNFVDQNKNPILSVSYPEGRAICSFTPDKPKATSGADSYSVKRWEDSLRDMYIDMEPGSIEEHALAAEKRLEEVREEHGSRVEVQVMAMGLEDLISAGLSPDTREAYSDFVRAIRLADTFEADILEQIGSGLLTQEQLGYFDVHEYLDKKLSILAAEDKKIGVNTTVQAVEVEDFDVDYARIVYVSVDKKPNDSTSRSAVTDGAKTSTDRATIDYLKPFDVGDYQFVITHDLAIGEITVICRSGDYDRWEASFPNAVTSQHAKEIIDSDEADFRTIKRVVPTSLKITV